MNEQNQQTVNKLTHNVNARKNNMDIPDTLENFVKSEGLKLIDQQARKISKVLNLYSIAAIDLAASFHAQNSNDWFASTITHTSNRVNSFATMLAAMPASEILVKMNRFAKNNSIAIAVTGFAVGLCVSRLLSQPSSRADTIEATHFQKKSSYVLRNPAYSNKNILEQTAFSKQHLLDDSQASFDKLVYGDSIDDDLSSAADESTGLNAKKMLIL